MGHSLATTTSLELKLGANIVVDVFPDRNAEPFKERRIEDDLHLVVVAKIGDRSDGEPLDKLRHRISDGGGTKDGGLHITLHHFLEKDNRVVTDYWQETAADVLCDHQHLIGPVTFEIGAKQLFDHRVGHIQTPIRKQAGCNRGVGSVITEGLK